MDDDKKYIKETVFTDYDTVECFNKYNDRFEKSTSEGLMYFKEILFRADDVFYFEYDNEKNKYYIKLKYTDKTVAYSEVIFNAQQQKELSSDKDSIFKNKINHLLSLSEDKKHYNEIEKRGTFENIEDAFFYVQYLEERFYIFSSDLKEKVERKMSGSLNYIAHNIDKADVEDLNRYLKFFNERLEEYYFQRKELSLSKKISKIIIACVLLSPYLIAYFNNASISDIIHIGIGSDLGILYMSLFFLNPITKSWYELDETKYHIRIMENYVNVINKQKELVLEKKQKNPSNQIVIKQDNNDKEKVQNNNIFVDPFVGTIYSIAFDSNKLTNEEERIEIIKEAVDILKKYRNRIEAINTNSDVIELTTDSEYLIKMETIKRIRELRNKLNNKLNQEYNLDNECEKVEQLLNSAINKKEYVKELKR